MVDVPCSATWNGSALESHDNAGHCQIMIQHVVVVRQLFQLNRGNVILTIHSLIGCAKRKICLIKSGVNSGIYPRSTGTINNEGATTVAGSDTQIHAQCSPWCKFGVLYKVPASMHDSSTSESTKEGEVRLLMIPVIMR